MSDRGQGAVIYVLRRCHCGCLAYCERCALTVNGTKWRILRKFVSKNNRPLGMTKDDLAMQYVTVDIIICIIA